MYVSTNAIHNKAQQKFHIKKKKKVDKATFSS